MGNKDVGDPQIRVWNPIMLWLFRHGWEDPTWGKKPIDQVTIGLAIHDLAAELTDESARKSIRTAAAGVVAKSSQAIAAQSI